MKQNIRIADEWPLWLIVALPFAYLAYLWPHLPTQVPIHWNMQGEIDRYANKIQLIMLPIMLPLLNYLLLLFIPFLDPKKKLKQNDRKYQSIKILMVTLMSALCLYILSAAKQASLSHPNAVVLLIGVVYMVLGNYLATLKANYFIGIRTPWTLEDEQVWKDTHRMAGPLWFGGGMATVLASILLKPSIMWLVFLAITALLVLVPMGYSYWRFRGVTKG